MKPLPCNSDLLEVAAHVIWLEPPRKALADPIRFLAYLMDLWHGRGGGGRAALPRPRRFPGGAGAGSAGHHRSAFLGLLERDDGTLSGPADAPARHSRPAADVRPGPPHARLLARAR